MKKYGLGNRITPYKDREIDLDSQVCVYRCLTRKGVVYSILQNNVVVGHTDCIMLRDVKFVVSKAGNKRVKQTKEKNVHAFAKGFITKQGGMATTAEECETRNEQLPAIITYNPYKYDSFICKNLTSKEIKVLGARFAVLNKYGLSGTYLETDPK